MTEYNKPLDIREIRDCQLFTGLTDDELESIAQLIEIREFNDGEVVVKEGAPGDEMFILLEGTLQVTQKLTLLSQEETNLNSRDKMLIKLEAASRPMVGEMSLFEEHYTRSATMTAMGQVTVGVITRQNLMNLVYNNNHLGYRLFYNIGLVLSARLKKANQDILKLTTAFSLALEKGW